MKTLHNLIIIVATLSLMACSGGGALGSLLNNTSGAGNVTTLWPDVPPLEGATKANLEMPLAFRLMIQAAFKGGLDYIAYTTTQTPAAVESFYSVERMQTDGWQAVDLEGKQASQQNCVSDQSGASSTGAVCLFGKKENGNDIILAIVVAEDEQTKQADVFYARINASEFETPGASQATPVGKSSNK